MPGQGFIRAKQGRQEKMQLDAAAAAAAMGRSFFKTSGTIYRLRYFTETGKV
jgi:hypothetical protein